MDDFLKMDIFFVVATIGIVVLTGLTAYALFLVVRILRNVERLSETVSDEALLIKADIDEMRTQVRAEGFKWVHIARFARSQVARLIKSFTGTTRNK